MKLYSGAPEKWHRQPFEQSLLFKGLEKKYYAIFWGGGYKRFGRDKPMDGVQTHPCVVTD